MTVREKPILFSGPMVRAILDGRKTQTRRVVKIPNPVFERVPEDCPYGIPGDRLWVRETWCCKMEDGTYVYRENCIHDCWYAADGKEIHKDDGDGGTEYRKDGVAASPWKPSIHMPRWASRISLEITGVHLEQLQDIKESGAKSEGAPMWVPGHGEVTMNDVNADPGYANFISYRLGFEMFWDSINAKRGFGWETNPLVWVITFKRL